MELTKRNKDMKELIEEAEKLYKEIDSIQMIWVASTKDNDEEGKRYAIGRMSVAMCSAMQLLKCFIDRKDNIVDLGKVWHNASITEEADRKKSIILDSLTIGDYYIPNRITFYSRAWIDCICAYNFRRWAYVDDLLPKGDAPWNITK